PARAHGREHRRAREGRSAGRALPLGRGREPARVPRAVPRPPGCRLPFSRARQKGTGRPPHLAPGVHSSHAAHDAQRRELRSVVVRDRALVGRASHGAGGQRLHGLPGRDPAGGWGRVAGVRTAATGLDREGRPLSNYMAPNDLTAKVTVLAEGTRGSLSQGWLEWQAVPSENPQIYALGVKEIWETKRPLDAIVHTLGWPVPTDAFGGSFMYPLEPNLVALGLVVGLDYHDATLDIHELLQWIKLHPLLRQYLQGGERVE